MRIAAVWRDWPAGCAAGLTTLLMQAVPQPAAAQSSIEELERKIEAAKEKKKRDAERPVAKPAAPPNTGRLVVDVDAACELRVNGERVRSFNAADTAVITLPAGEQLIECLSVAHPGAKARTVVEVSSGKQAVLTLSVLEAEGPARAADAKARAAAGAKARAADAEAAMAKRFQALSDSVVFDAQAGVQWTRSDNGSRLNWSQAQAYCQGLGAGWSLPTVAQLKSIYDENWPHIPCGVSYVCRIPNQFRLSSFWFWSSEPMDSEYRYVVLTNGGGGRALPRYALNERRALCVRGP